MTDLQQEYKRMTGSYIPYKFLDFNTLLAMVEDMNDVVRLETLPSGDLLVKAVADEVNCQKENLDGYNQHTGKLLADSSGKRIEQNKTKPLFPSWASPDTMIPLHIKDRLLMIIKSSRGGLMYSELCRKYRLEYKEDIDPLCYGQTSVLGLCCQLSDLITVQEVDSDGMDWILLPVSKPVLSFIEMTSSLEISHLKKSPLEIQNIPSSLAVGDCLEVITTITSQSEIYVQLKDAKTKLWELSLELGWNRWVHEPISMDQLRVGCCGVVEVESVWYRVEVIAIENLRIKVFMIDYGKVIEVASNKLRHLSEQFARLPAQAIPVSLANYTKWPQNLCDKLIEKSMFVEIKRLPNEHTKMEVVLVE